MGGVDRLGFGAAPRSGQRAEQVLPNTAPSPAHEAVIDGGRRAVFRRTVTPAAAAAQHMDDTADHAPVINTLLTAHIARQMRLYPLPFPITQPVQVLAHLQVSESKHQENHQPIQQATNLLGFDPSDE